MDIARIWMSQKNLRRIEQIPAMVETLKHGEILPKIILNQCEDGEIQIQDGHHRLVAIWLSGKTKLEKHEYLLVQKDQWRIRCGKIRSLII